MPTPLPISTPIPSPSTLIVTLANDGAAPWWGVPLIAGGFLLVGGFLTFLFTRLNENSKFKKERRSRDNKEIADRGAELLSAGSKLREIALLGLNRSMREMVELVATTGNVAIDDFTLASNKFRLVHPIEMTPIVTTYMGLCMALLMPPYDKDGQQRALDAHSEATHAFVNSLRVIEGRKPFKRGASGSSSLVEKTAKLTGLIRDQLAAERKAAESENPSAPPASSAKDEEGEAK